MRPLIMAFLILAPFIAVAQNYHLHAPITALAHVPVAHFTQSVVANASMTMGDMVHAVQEFLG